jgi:hypothetical protein
MRSDPLAWEVSDRYSVADELDLSIIHPACPHDDASHGTAGFLSR